MIIEKILPVIIVAALFVTGLSYGGSDIAVSYVTPDTSNADYYADEYHEIYLSQLDADLVARGREAGFSLDISISCYISSDGSPIIVPEIEIRSAIGTAMYGSNTVDWELMREIEYAAIDANLFNLSPDGMSAAKNIYYTPDDNYADEDVEGMNIHINETPSGYEAIFMMRYLSADLPSEDNPAWTLTYNWDELTYDSRAE